MKRYGTAKIISNRTSGKAAKTKYALCVPSLEAGQSPYFASPVDIYVNSYLARYDDTDGPCEKWAIDELVSFGIIKDDSSKYVRRIIKQNFKVKNASEEKTEIIVTEVEDA